MTQAVKEANPGPAPRGIAKHFDGWQVGVALVIAAGLAASIGVPRPVAPEHIPLPEVDARDLASDLRREAERAALARAEPLSFEVRAIGEALRKVGAVEAAVKGPAAGLAERRYTLEARVRRLRQLQGAQADTALLSLRAVQAELFVSALRVWDGSPSSELNELGGAITGTARHPAWFEGHRFLGSDEDAATLFRLRWNQLCNLTETPPFSATPAERLSSLRFLLRHPEGSTAQEQLTRQLSYVEAVAARQPTYPVALTKGTLFYRMGNYGLAAAAFQQHLQNPDGPYSLRARNHLLAASERQREQELGLGR